MARKSKAPRIAKAKAPAVTARGLVTTPATVTDQGAADRLTKLEDTTFGAGHQPAAKISDRLARLEETICGVGADQPADEAGRITKLEHTIFGVR